MTLPGTIAWSAIQRRQAWAVHVFTTMGLVCGMLALREVLVGDARLAMIWLFVTLIIDGVDGPVARAMFVKERVPRIDGYILDLIIDFVTCVIVPAAFMYQFDLLPAGGPGLALLGLLVFTSAIWFARTDMMSEDNWFSGFPAGWNLVAPVLYLTDAEPMVGAVVTLVLAVASLTDIQVPHVVRCSYLRPVTLTFSALWLGSMVLGALLLPDRSLVVQVLLMVGSAYFVALTVTRTWQFKHGPHAAGL